MSPKKKPEEELNLEPKPEGTVFQVVANALHSRTYKGKVELGTYNREQDAIKRLRQVVNEGYQMAEIVESLSA